MIAKVAYDVHKLPSSETRIIAGTYKVPYVQNGLQSGVAGYGHIPNSQNRCNGVLTSRNVLLCPIFGSGENVISYSKSLANVNYDWNDMQKTLVFWSRSHDDDGKATFDFFNPSTESFVPWSLYKKRYQGTFDGYTVDGYGLCWKDANGNEPPSIDGIDDCIIWTSSLYTGSIYVFLCFDGFAVNPFSDTDPVVARLSIQCQATYPDNNQTNTYPKYTGCRMRNNLSQTTRCMPYQFEWDTSKYGENGYNISDQVTAKAIAFGMTNWVKIHDESKAYILADQYTEHIPRFEYQKYLEFSDL